MSEFLPLLENMQRHLSKSYSVTDYFAYECGYTVEKLRLLDYASEQELLVWFVAYSTINKVDASLLQSTWQKLEKQYLKCRLATCTSTRIKRNIGNELKVCASNTLAGNVYQFNLTEYYLLYYLGELLRPMHVVWLR